MFFAQTNYWNREDEADILSHCKRTGEKTWESVNGYLPNCPLIPVPPHGRLGDLDRMLVDNETYYNQLGRPNGVIRTSYMAVKHSIEIAPAIIQAEGKNTDVPAREEGE
jgi:hypothetical protein